MHNSGPIFIHSLFRCASTWLFQRFREAQDGAYWCYQEPFNEALIALNDNPEGLLSYSTEVAQSLRHPRMSAPYYQEFVALKDTLANQFDKRISYDSFFDPSECPALFAYTKTLISSARGVPVLQCCRSFGRVAALKQRYDGVHLLLWRMPRSQWLSYQINDYFDTTSLLFLNAANPPPLMQKIHQEIGFSEFHAATVEEEYAHFLSFPLDHRQRYLVFYALWLYHLIENQSHCDISLQVDALGVSEGYTRDCTEQLRSHGIEGIELSGCNTPVIPLAKQETRWFEDIEERVEQLFAETGYSAESIENTRQLKRNHQPDPASHNPDALLESAQRARAIGWRYADRWADSARHVREIRTHLAQTKAECDSLRDDTRQAQQTAEQVSRELVEAQAACEEARAAMEDAHREMALARAAEHRAQSESHQAKARIHELEAARLRALQASSVCGQPTKSDGLLE